MQFGTTSRSCKHSTGTTVFSAYIFALCGPQCDQKREGHSTIIECVKHSTGTRRMCMTPQTLSRGKCVGGSGFETSTLQYDIKMLQPGNLHNPDE